MQRPDLNRIWETHIRILPDEKPVNIIRLKILPLISRSRDEDMIGWYHFLVHPRPSELPPIEGDTNRCFHIRFEFKGTDPSKVLPDFCVVTRKIGRIESIHGIDRSLLKDERIEDAWRVIGEQSEWVMNMLDIHKGDVDVPPDQIMQFLHYFFNMMQLGVRCPTCGQFVPL